MKNADEMCIRDSSNSNSNSNNKHKLKYVNHF